MALYDFNLLYILKLILINSFDIATYHMQQSHLDGTPSDCLNLEKKFMGGEMSLWPLVRLRRSLPFITIVILISNFSLPQNIVNCSYI